MFFEISKRWTPLSKRGVHLLNHRIGYFGEQRDKESDYFAMGFRLYDPEIGRFLAIDPLLDVQPSQTPYHYCFNNPTSFTDPTGLYPEKEKGDKVQTVVSFYWALEEALQALMNSRIQFEENWQMSRRQWRGLFYLISDRNYYKRMNGDEGGGGGGGGSSSGRTGTKESGNGVFAGSLTLNKPKNAGVDAIYEACKPAFERLAELQNENPDKEVGFFLVWNKKLNEYRADFYVGKDIGDWLTLYAKKPPDGFLNIIGDVGMGFTHSHLNGQMYFGPDDLQAISAYSLGELKWAGVPNQNVNKEPAYLDSMFFGLMVNGQIVEAFSWKQAVTPSGLTALYNNIRAMSYSSNYERFILNTSYFGGEQWKKRK